jgi:hypothetical protein
MYHPEGVASLVAAILCTGDIAKLPTDVILRERRDLLERAIDFRREQILELAREYYKVYDQDYEDNVPLVEVRNAANNRAKLGRANLMFTV